ncbi:MAG: SEC-C metal-binding domain-containing protein [Thermoanaerobaculia bacterium]
MQAGRNESCPCGSGKKYKRCCLLAGSERGFRAGSRIASIQSPADLRRYADSLTGQLPLLALPRVEAVLHSFRILQTLHSLNGLKAHERRRYASDYESMRNCQDLLRWMAFKLFELCPPGGSPAPTLPEHVRPSLAAITHFFSFSILQDLTLCAEHGYLRHRVSEPGLHEFLPLEGPEGERLRNRLVRDASERDLRRERKYEELSRLSDSPLVTEYRAFARSIRMNGDSLELSYDAPHNLISQMMDVFNSTSPPPLLPQEWSVGAYDLGQFRNFWVVLLALAGIHEMAFLEGARALAMEWGPHNTASLIMPRSMLLHRASEHAGLPEDTTREIIRDLTYDPNVRWTDIMYQPLVPVGADELLALPLVIGGSSFERNLLAMVDRLPWRQASSHRLKEGREQLMLDEIMPVLAGSGLLQRPRIQVATGGTDLGDIDLLVWEPTGAVAMCVSLKWFYGPDSIREVLTHDQWYAEAIRRCLTMREYVRKDPIGFCRDRGIKPGFSEATLVHGCIVSREDTPSEKVFAPDVPVVSLRQFTALVVESNRDLRALHRRLCQLAAGSPPAEETEHFQEEIRFGDLRLSIPILGVVESS